MTNEVTSTGNAQMDLKSLVQRITAVFLIPPSGDDLLSTFNEQTNAVRTPFKEIAEAFRSNIIGLLTTVAFPYTLAHTAAVDRNYQRISSAERIRALKLNHDTGESQADLEVRREVVARKKSISRMEEFTSSPDGTNAIINDSLTFLERALRDENLSKSANELTLQGIVLCWGAFEVLAHDVFVTLLNIMPQLTETLLKDPIAKRRFELAKFSLETLAAHKFDLSGKMGSILAQQQDLSDLHSIKAVYEALFPADKNLRDALTDIDIRLLSQRRNLVVHRRGAIDDLYIKAVNCDQIAGEQLRIHPDELEKYVKCSASAASALLLAVSALLSSTGENKLCTQ